jgi:hypothetical protein
MKAFIEVGIVKETEKAMLVTYWTSGNYRGFKSGEKYEVVTAWLPKSQVEVLESGEKTSRYNTYHNLRCNAYGTISEGTVKKHTVRKSAKLAVPQWLYNKTMVYGFGI